MNESPATVSAPPRFNAPSAGETLNASLRERVLEGLGLSEAPEPTVAGLRLLYGAWCRRVPFDNVRKLIHVRSGNAGPLPGHNAADYFEAWLRHGTGGTCWAGAGALDSLLVSLGFDTVRGVATMLAAPDLPPNHGTVVVRFEDASTRFLVDSSILHGEPLPLPAVDSARAIEHPAWGVQASHLNGRPYIFWRPLHRTDGFACRLDRFGAGAEEFAGLYEKTRPWSPFNYQLTARLNRGESVVGASFGHAVSLLKDGSVSDAPIAHQERVRMLIEDFGMSEEIVAQLPHDVPTPPPPGSQAAHDAPTSV